MDKTLHGWSKNFDKINKKWVGMFEANVKQDYKRIEEYGLPTYQRMFFEALDLADDFNNCISKILLERYYIQLYPKSANMPKYSLTDFTDPFEIQNFINKKISDKLSDYYVLISEFEPNIYGGSIMSTGNEIHIDICEGLQNAISYGTAISISCKVIYGEIMQTDTLPPEMLYIFKQILSSIKLCVPSSTNEYLEGYFEFAITQKKLDINTYRLIFIDYKMDRIYYNI